MSNQNNFHIYEQIGRGKHSTVYKSRRKQTIQYFAVKSVSKQQKSRVLQEVRVLHSLKHESVLRFHAWYETSNHLWLILEYCVGGNLHTLLRQDGALPEASVHDFARALAKALRFLHSQGIVWVDMKPSNVLLDGDGRLKLAGFGLSKRLSDIEREAAQTTGAATGSSAAAPAARHGTPCYMAPELFADGSVHSFASDLWALGCVIYECAAGRPPFVDASFQRLVAMILDDEPAPLPDIVPPEMCDLVARLLEKDPARRIGWEEVAAHPAWREPLPPATLPTQRAFEAFLRRSRLANSGTSTTGVIAVESAACSPAQVATRQEQQEQQQQPLQDHDAKRRSADATAAPRVGKENAASRGALVRRSSAARRSGNVDVLRLSLAARDNQEDEAEAGGGYADKGSAGAGGGREQRQLQLQQQGDSDGGDVSLSDTDTELNFEAGSGGGDAGAALPHGDGQAATGGGAAETGGANDVADDVAPSEVSTEEPDASSFGRTSRAMRRSGAFESAIAAAAAAGVDNDAAHGGGEPADARAERAAVAQEVEELLWHRSDMTVKPIVQNRRIERVAEPTFDRRLLPFRPATLDAMLAMPQTELEDFLTAVYRSLSGSASLQERLNSLCYFETLCANQSAANVLINSSLMGLLVRIMRSAKSPALRARLASVMGTLLRHATYISEELAQSGLAEALVEAVAERDERLKRRAMAALGELLFYVATQQQEQEQSSPSPWEVPEEAVGAMVRLLRPGEDEVAAHYAAKSVENVASGAGEWSARVSTPEMANALASLYGTCRSEQLRATLAGALARVLRQQRWLIAGVLHHAGGTRLLVRGVADTQLRAAQAMASAACLALMDAGGGEGGRPAVVLSAAEEKVLLPPLLACLEQPGVVLRAKACLALLLLVRRSPRALRQACAARLLPTLDRLASDGEFVGDGFGAAALHALEAGVVRSGRGIMEAVAVELRQRKKGGGDRSDRERVHSAQPGSALPLFPAVLFLAGSASLRADLLGEANLSRLGELVRLTLAPRVSGGAFSAGGVPLDFASVLLQTVEAVASQPDLVLDTAAVVGTRLLPALADAVAGGGGGGELRFQALRCVADLLAPILSTPVAYELHAEAIADACIHRLGPAYAGLLADEEPIPLATLKLLGALVERDAARYAVAAARSGLVPPLLSFLRISSMLCNIHNIRLVRQLMALDESELPTGELVRHDAAAGLAGVLEYAAANSVGPFLEPALTIGAALLLRGADTGGQLAALAPVADGLRAHEIERIAAAAEGFARACAAST